jgi:hypothetical protein
MVSVLAPSAVNRGFQPRSDQTKDYKIGICCFSTKNFGIWARFWNKIAFLWSINHQDDHFDKNVKYLEFSFFSWALFGRVSETLSYRGNQLVHYYLKLSAQSLQRKNCIKIVDHKNAILFQKRAQIPKFCIFWRYIIFSSNFDAVLFFERSTITSKKKLH